jgi:simple sugar transport system ATP-binding protein
MDVPASAHRLVMATAAGVPMLSLEHVHHRFGGVVALDDASLVVRPGTVHALLGENGAGKSTLMRVAFGLLQPQAGVLRRDGTALSLRSPADALAQGIGMVHQHFTLVPAMTVAENVALGGRGAFDPRRAAERVRTVAAQAGLALDPDARVDTLPVGAQQRCEIVKALARDVRVLILDEPTAVLAPVEATELLAWVRRHANAGNAVVLITHKLRDALAVADDITVLRRGHTVLTAPAAACTQETLAQAMLGEGAATERAATATMDQTATVSELVSTEAGAGAIALIAETASHAVGGAGHDHAPSRGVVLAADALSWRDARGVLRVDGVTLTVRAGEIVGIAAVEGAGQHELLRLLAGRLPVTTGRVQRPASLGFVPEDRHRDALLLDAPLFENLALRDAGARRGRMAWPAFALETRALMTQFDVRAASASSAARTLSGGNQQRFVLARELAQAPEALIVENPSRGLDFRATASVQAALRQARDAGTAVLVYSGDLDELLLLADRVYAMHAGRVREVRGDRDAVGRAMLGDSAA